MGKHECLLRQELEIRHTANQDQGRSKTRTRTRTGSVHSEAGNRVDVVVACVSGFPWTRTLAHWGLSKSRNFDKAE